MVLHTTSGAMHGAGRTGECRTRPLAATTPYSTRYGWRVLVASGGVEPAESDLASTPPASAVYCSHNEPTRTKAEYSNVPTTTTDVRTLNDTPIPQPAHHQQRIIHRDTSTERKYSPVAARAHPTLSLGRLARDHRRCSPTAIATPTTFNIV